MDVICICVGVEGFVVTPMGTAVEAVIVVRLGTGTEVAAVVVVADGTVVVWSYSEVLAVVTTLVDVRAVVVGTCETVVEVSLGGAVGGPGVIELVGSPGDLVVKETLSVVVLTVDLSVFEDVGVTCGVTGTLEVILVVVTREILVDGAIVVLVVDITLVVTLSG